MFGVIFALLPTKDSRWLFFYSLCFLLVFVLTAYSPHRFTEYNNAESLQPPIFFMAGAFLIVVGCFMSFYFSKAMSNLNTLGHIGEIGPLILGAVVGGNYCSDAILGQKLNGKVYRLEWNPLSLVGPAIIIITLFFQINNPSLFLSIIIIGIGLSPLIALSLLSFSLKLTKERDTAFWTLVIGFMLIVVAILGTMFLLDAIYHARNAAEPYSQTMAFILVKNLVPAYCASIGAGLILRAIQENITPFSLSKWAEKHFKYLEIVSVSETELIFRRDIQNSQQKQTITLGIGPTLISALKENAFERNLYGAAAGRWLSEYLDTPNRAKDAEIGTSLPNADKLRRSNKSSKKVR